MSETKLNESDCPDPYESLWVKFVVDEHRGFVIESVWSFEPFNADQMKERRIFKFSLEQNEDDNNE